MTPDVKKLKAEDCKYLSEGFVITVCKLTRLFTDYLVDNEEATKDIGSILDDLMFLMTEADG